jgi:toxin ParE1/3/4
MPKVLKRPQAEADLDDIWWYIAQDNPTAADGFLDKIEEHCRMLAQTPYIGRSRDELLSSLRSFVIGNYLVFYIPIEGGGGIEVVRVLHGARDIEVLFRNATSQ